MYRLCLVGCVLLLAACGDKAPDEGAIRVSVKYGSFQPACVRVEVKDASGHGDRTDILSSQFKNADKKEVRVAVRRKADWDAALNVTASSYAAATANSCDGPFVEKYESEGALAIVARKFTNFDVTLKATDADGDGHLTGAMWDEPADCDDSNAARHPEAVETCGSTEDLNCNGLKGCQEPNCGGKSCDDGNACTTGDHCEGSGLEAKCMPTRTTTCAQPTGICDARQACNPSSGVCEAVESTVGKTCDDGDRCTVTDVCGTDGTCKGTARSCNNTMDQCRASAGTCAPDTGDCVFTPLPPTTSCQDSRTCTTDDHCDGSGNCVGTPGCTPAACMRVKQQCTASTECTYEVDLNAACTTSGGLPGVCTPTAECSPFPYRPSNFDPDAIAAMDIGELRTTANVTFDTATQTWSPEGSVPTRDSIKFTLLPQGAGNPPAVLIPVKALELNGTLTIVGPSPVILAVYGDANVSQSILATGTITHPNTACDASQGAAGTFGTNTGGGGGGGGNAIAGASGGKGYDNSQPQGGGGTLRPSSAEPLLGGCPGGSGGGGTSSEGGLGGAGGGAIQLSVARTLTLSKNISTSGNAGEGGKSLGGKGGGGGGGGSGGRVILEAFQLKLTSAARVTANGGGGGEGGSTSTFNSGGRSGSNGSQDSTAPAAGGAGGATTGGDGGAGGTGTAEPGKGLPGEQDGFGTAGGGGGGGGAAGFIQLRSVQSCALDVGHVLSPPATGGCTVP